MNPETDGRLVERIEESTGGQVADVILEVMGNPQVRKEAFKSARRLGRVVLLGSPRGPVTVDFQDEVHTLSLRVIGTHTSSRPEAHTWWARWTAARNLDAFFRLVEVKRLETASMVTHRIPGTEAAKTFELLDREREETCAVVLDWTGVV